MATTINAIVFTGVDQITLRRFELGPCSPKEIVVRTLYTMVSTGTELRVLGGHYGAMEQFPLIPGYSVIGEVVQVGAEVQGYRVGDLISGRNPRPVPGINSQWGGQASMHVYTTSGEDRPVLLPTGAKPLDYVIAEISSISLRGVVATAPQSGETAVVLGQGLIGALSAAWLSLFGCRVTVCDVEPGRLEKAVARGASAAVNVTDADALARLGIIGNGGADIVVESSGTEKGVMLAYKLIRKKPQAYGTDYKVEPIHFYGSNWPRLVMQANYLDNVTINPFSFFVGEGITILAPKDHGIEDRQQAIEYLRRGLIRSSDFIQKLVPFTKAPEAYMALKTDKNANFTLVFDWSKA